MGNLEAGGPQPLGLLAAIPVQVSFREYLGTNKSGQRHERYQRQHYDTGQDERLQTVSHPCEFISSVRASVCRRPVLA